MQRYAAIDIETTGTDPDLHQMLEIACVVETDWSTPVDLLPSFRVTVRPYGQIVGTPCALLMNERLLRELAGGGGVSEQRAVQSLADFLTQHFADGHAVSIAGKNFGSFDFQFLRRVPEWAANVRHKHRFIDAGALWWEPEKDRCLPDLKTSAQRGGLRIRREHEALEDCRTVIECVRAWHQREKKAA